MARATLVSLSGEEPKSALVLFTRLQSHLLAVLA